MIKRYLGCRKMRRGKALGCIKTANRRGTANRSQLRRLAHVSAFFATAHYYLQVKAEVRLAITFASVRAGLLLCRVIPQSSAPRIVCAWLVLFLSLQSPVSHGAQRDQPNVLDLPRIVAEQTTELQQGLQLLKSGKHEEARQLFQHCTERIEHDLTAHYNLACAQALLGQPQAAIASLDRAIELGYRAGDLLSKDPDLLALRDLPDFARLIEACNQPALKETVSWKYSVEPAQPLNGLVVVDSANILWNAKGKLLQVFVDASDAGKEQPIVGSQDAIGSQLTKWFDEGSAAGNVGDLYNNHDKQHSPLNLAMFPQLTRIMYGIDITERKFDNGLQNHFLFSNTRAAGPDNSADAARDAVQAGRPGAISRTVVLGNSSTAVTGSIFWRSMPRLALTLPGGTEMLVHHYLNNHLYVYPEHRDHDPGHDEAVGWGDVYFANTPYYVTSQGSSGTDQVFLQAFAATLAAMHPELKQKLRDAGLIAPTLQMIFRSCNRQVRSDDDYLSGIAHPTVFEGSQLDTQRMIEMAHAMKAAEAPPLVVLTVESEEVGDLGRDIFDSTANESILNSPCAVARLCSSTKYWRELEVSASSSADPNGLPLTFRWVVLRGDPQRIELLPVEGDPSARRIRVGYHRRRAVPPAAAIQSNRVDIGVFAHNGKCFSAPAFLSFAFPDNEVRQYDDQHRILSVDYLSAARNYVDPALVAQRDWRDDYHYDESGELHGWTRTREGGRKESFNAQGQLVIESGIAGTESELHVVHYERIQAADGRQQIRQVHK